MSPFADGLEHSARKSLRPASLILAATALLLPVGMLANLAARVGGAETEEIVAGLWLLKAILVVFAAGIILLRRHLSPTSRSPHRVTLEEDVRRGTPWLWGLLSLALVIRIVGLGSGLWYDEILTLVRFVRLPTLGLLTTFDSQNNHILYSLLSRPVVLALGESPLALRLPAVIFGVGSLWALFNLTRQLADRRQAYLATGLLTFSYHHVWFSQNARGYTALLFFTLLSTSAFIWLLRGRLRYPLLGILAYSAASALGAFAHLTGVFTLAAHVLIWAAAVFRGKLGEPLPGALGLAGATVLCATLYAPIAPQLVGTVAGSGELAVSTPWQNPLWMVSEMARGLASGLPGGWLTLGIGATIGSLGLVSYARSGPSVLGMMLLPPFLCSVALIVTSHNLWPRFYFFSAGFGAIIVTRGWLHAGRLLLNHRGERIATGALTLAILGSATIVPRAWAPKQDFEGAARHVQSVSGVDDVVLTAGLAALPFDAYLQMPWRSVSEVNELLLAEDDPDAVRLLITFPSQLRVTHPEIWARVQTEYSEERRFPATVNEGEILVMVKK